MDCFEDNLESAIEYESKIVSDPQTSNEQKVESLARMEKIHQIMLDEREMSLKEKKYDHDVENSDIDQRDKKLIYNENQKQKIIEYVIRGAELILPLVCYGVWTTRGFRFEREGVYTSKTFQNIIGKIKPTKK